MSRVGMQTSYDTCQIGSPFRRLARRFSISHVVDHFQRAFLTIDLFGFSCGVIIVSSLFSLISMFNQGAQSGAEKGVI